MGAVPTPILPPPPGLLTAGLWANPEPHKACEGQWLSIRLGRASPALRWTGQLQTPATTVFSLIFNYFTFPFSTSPISTFTMVRLPMVMSEMTGYQNDVACAWVVGLQMVLFLSPFLPCIFQIRVCTAFKTRMGRVTYRRILTLASQCLRMSFHRQVTLSGLIP